MIFLASSVRNVKLRIVSTVRTFLIRRILVDKSRLPTSNMKVVMITSNDDIPE